jgi:hypothetical protein
LTIDYDVSNGSVFQVAASLNGVPYKPSGTLAITNTASNSSSGVPSAAAAKKVLPAFVIFQLLLSCFTVGGAAWLAWGDDMAKYNRLEDRESTFIPAKVKGHKAYDSIGSVDSDAVFPVQVERRTTLLGRHRATESTTDLVSHGAIMESTTPRHSESSDDLEAGRSAVRPEGPVASGGYFERRQSELWM